MTEPSLQALHSQSAAPTWPPLTLREVTDVLDRCGLSSRTTTISWHSERPLSAAAIVNLGPSSVFIKRHHESVRTAAQLKEEHRYIQHLHSRGGPVNRILTAADGETAFTFGDYTYEVQERAEGVDLYRRRASWTPFLSQSHAVAAGRALALLHKAARGYDAPARGAHVLVSSYRAIPAEDPVAAILDQFPRRPALQGYLERHAWREDIGRALAPFHQDFFRCVPRLAPLWTHNDWHASNLLWSGEGDTATVRTVVDFGLCDRTTAVYDLATALERSTIPWIDIQDGKSGVADLDLVARLLEGYAQEIELTAGERAGLVAILPIVHVEYALAEIEYFAGVTRSTEHADLAYHAFLIRHCEWFTEPAGRQLLTRLRTLLEAL